MILLGTAPMQKHVLVLPHRKIPTRTVRSPSWRLRLLNTWEEIRIMLKSPSHFSLWPWKEVPESSFRGTTPAQRAGHWAGERFKGKQFDVGVTNTISMNHSFKNFTYRKTWKKPSRHREPPKCWMQVTSLFQVVNSHSPTIHRGSIKGWDFNKVNHHKLSLWNFAEPFSCITKESSVHKVKISWSLAYLA